MDLYELPSLPSLPSFFGGGPSKATMIKIGKANPRIAREYLAGATTKDLIKKYPKVAKEYGLSLMNLSSTGEDRVVTINGVETVIPHTSSSSHTVKYFKGLQDLSSSDDIMKLSGSAMLEIQQNYPHIAQEFLSGAATVSELA